MQTFRPLGPDTGMKITTSRYYTPSGRSIQEPRASSPDVLIDDTRGSPTPPCACAKADLGQAPDQRPGKRRKTPRAKARDGAAKRPRRKSKPCQTPPRTMAPEGLPTHQALNQLKGQPVLVSKTQVERKGKRSRKRIQAASHLPPSRAMDDQQLLRYSRHILLDEIGVEGQARILASSALVVGLGVWVHPQRCIWPVRVLAV